MTVKLLNSSGQVVATTTTDSNGNYAFNGLAPGTITAFRKSCRPAITPKTPCRATPAERNTDNQDIDKLTLAPGQAAMCYDFYIVPPARSDRPGDGQPDRLSYDESWTLPGVANVTVNLLNSSGQVVATTTTDSRRRLQVYQLAPGIAYSLQEVMPPNYYAGDAVPGDAGGTSGDTDIVGLIASPGQAAMCYDFYIVAAGQSDRPRDGQSDRRRLRRKLDAARRSNVTVNLLNASGQIVATTKTEANGDYAFNNLQPGVKYSVQEIVPRELLCRGRGSRRCRRHEAGPTPDIVGLIASPGQAAMCYDFYIVPPASLTGRVMVNLTGSSCDESYTLPGVANVDGQSAQCSNQIVATTITDANGDYAFNNLQPGVDYSVQEIVPAQLLCRRRRAGRRRGDEAGRRRGYRRSYASPGQAAMCYDFYIVPPASLTGRVMVNLTGLNCNESWTLPGVPERDGQFAQCQQSSRGHHGHRLQRRLRIRQSDARPIQRPRAASQRAISPRTPRPAMPAARPPDAEDIVGLTLTPGQAAMCYDFYVMPPATISGTVFQDGAPIQIVPGETRRRAGRADRHSGRRRSADRRRDAPTGQRRDRRPDPRIASLARLLQSQAPDYNGHRRRRRLFVHRTAGGRLRRDRNRAAADTSTASRRAGSTGGVVVGPYTQTRAAVLAGLTVPAPHDAIMGIASHAGPDVDEQQFQRRANAGDLSDSAVAPGGPTAAAANMYSQYFPLVVVPISAAAAACAADGLYRLEPGARIQLAPERGQRRSAACGRAIRRPGQVDGRPGRGTGLAIGHGRFGVDAGRPVPRAKAPKPPAGCCSA